MYATKRHTSRKKEMKGKRKVLHRLVILRVPTLDAKSSINLPFWMIYLTSCSLLRQTLSKRFPINNCTIFADFILNLKHVHALYYHLRVLISTDKYSVSTKVKSKADISVSFRETLAISEIHKSLPLIYQSNVLSHPWNYRPPLKLPWKPSRRGYASSHLENQWFIDFSYR